MLCGCAGAFPRKEVLTGQDLTIQTGGSILRTALNGELHSPTQKPKIDTPFYYQLNSIGGTENPQACLLIGGLPMTPMFVVVGLWNVMPMRHCGKLPILITTLLLSEVSSASSPAIQPARFFILLLFVR